MLQHERASEYLTARELLTCTPSAASCSRALAICAAWSEALRDDPQALEMIDHMYDSIDTLEPPRLCAMLRGALVTVTYFGNFCVDGGRVAFVQKPKGETNATKS